MHFVETIIAYLRHAAGMGCFVTPGWQHLRRYQPGANHNRVPPARCSFHSPTARNKPLHGIGTRPPPETNHCTASDIDSNHGIGTRPTARNKPLLGIGHCFKSRHRLLTEGQQTNHHIAMGDVVIRLLKFCCSFALFRCESQAHTAVVAAVNHRATVTVRYAAASSAAAPATTAQHAVRPTRGTGRIGLGATAIAAIPVIAPLIHIATHVVQPKYICCLTGYQLAF